RYISIRSRYPSGPTSNRGFDRGPLLVELKTPGYTIAESRPVRRSVVIASVLPACHPRRVRACILRIVAFCVTVLVCSRVAFAELPTVGTLVSKDNSEKYAEVLNPTQQYMLKHGATMPVTEYRKYEWQAVYKEATEKYSSQVRLSPDGRDIVNYVAGAPFPVIDENDPQAGPKWMWDHEQGPKYTDNVGVGWNVELVNERGERERFFGSNFLRRMVCGGLRVPEPRAAGVSRAGQMYYTQSGSV